MKKLLSILLTTAMLVSVFAISASAFVPTRVITNDVVQTYDGTDEVNFTLPISDDAPVPTIEDGVLKLTTNRLAAMGYYGGIRSEQEPASTNYTIQFDITRNADITYEAEVTDPETGETTTETVTLTEDGTHKATLAIMLPRNTTHAALGAFGLWLPMDGMETGKARTFSITVDEAAAANATATQVTSKTASGRVTVFTEVKYIDEGDTEWTYPARSGSSATAYEYRVYAGQSAAQRTEDAGKTTAASNAASINVYAEGITIGTRLNAISNSSNPGADEEAYSRIPYTYDNVMVTSIGGSYAINEGIKFTQDFETANANFSPMTTALAVAEASESNGNKFYRLTPNANIVKNVDMSTTTVEDPQWLATYQTTNSTNCNVYPNSVVTLDVRYVTKGMPLTLLVAKNADYYENTTNGKKPLSLMLHPRELGKWYTYKIEMSNFTTSDNVEDFTTVYVKERGAADSTYTRLSGMYIGGGAERLVWNNPEEQYNMDNYGYSYSIGWGTVSNGKTAHIGYSTYKLANASWTEEIFRGTITDIDNFQIRDKVAFTGENASVADGVLTSALTIDTAEEAPAAAIVAVYNTDGRLADVAFDVLTGGSDNLAENSVDFDATQEAVLYIWSDFATDATPLCAPYTGLVAE